MLIVVMLRFAAACWLRCVLWLLSDGFGLCDVMEVLVWFCCIAWCLRGCNDAVVCNVVALWF